MVHHAGWTSGQLSSLLAGLDAVDDPALEAIAVTLVDVPLVRAATVAACCRRLAAVSAPIVRRPSASAMGTR